MPDRIAPFDARSPIDTAESSDQARGQGLQVIPTSR